MRSVLALAALLLFSSLHAWGEDSRGQPKLKEADRKLQIKINRAIRKGRGWLLTQQRKDGSFPHPYAAHFSVGGTSLSILTLLHCGVKPEDRAIRKGFEFIRRHYARTKKERASGSSGLMVYETAVTIMALAQLGTDREPTRKGRRKERVELSASDRRWMREMTDWLVEHQDADGGWGYPVPRRTDPSNSQYALLALKEARRLKMRVPAHVFTKALDFWVNRQEKSGPKVRRYEEQGGDGVFNAHRTVARVWDHARGWGYRGSGPYGSMTAAGVAATAILRSELRGRRPRVAAERAMHDGLAWLGQYFSATTNPGPGNPGRHHYYYLYGLERAGVLGGVVWMGEHRWYAEGARVIVDAQEREGGWVPTEKTAHGVVDPCFALLFLARSTMHSYGVTEITPQGPVSLDGGDKLPDRELDDVFQLAFSEMFRLGLDLRKARAREFAKLGPRVIGLLLPKLADPEEAVRDRAILILRSVTGKQMGYDPTASEAARSEARARWMTWYGKNRAGLSPDAQPGPSPSGPDAAEADRAELADVLAALARTIAEAERAEVDGDSRCLSAAMSALLSIRKKLRALLARAKSASHRATIHTALEDVESWLADYGAAAEAVPEGADKPGDKPGLPHTPEPPVLPAAPAEPATPPIPDDRPEANPKLAELEATRTLSTWCRRAEALYADLAGPEERGDLARKAADHAGISALPALARWFEQEDSAMARVGIHDALASVGGWRVARLMRRRARRDQPTRRADALEVIYRCLLRPEEDEPERPFVRAIREFHRLHDRELSLGILRRLDAMGAPGVAALGQVLYVRDFGYHDHTIELLAKKRDPRAVPPLVYKMNRFKFDYREQLPAHVALVRIGWPAVPPLIDRLDDKAAGIWISWTLRKITRETTGTQKRKWQEWWKKEKARHPELPEE